MLVVIWIDWYAYHHARLRALAADPRLAGRVVGIELVGRTGVHKGLVFREQAEATLPLITLLPNASWTRVTQWKLALLLWRQLNRQNPSVVLVPGYYNVPAVAAALWARFHGRRSVLMTESTRFDHARTPWKERVKAAVIRLLFDGAIAGGEAHVRYLEALGFPESRIARRYDVVDNDFFASRARELRKAASPEAPFFLYVGRLAPEKNVIGLIRAYAEYRRDGGKWPLVLVGGGSEEKALRAAASASGFAAGIEFAGLQSTGALPGYYARAGCFVLPSKCEPWGLVVNEAMASGLPVIVSNRCGAAEDLVVDGRNGFVFDPYRDGALRECLHRISVTSQSERAVMGRASEESVERFSPARWADEVARIERVVSPQPTPGCVEAVL
jgi:glycosyltransferase involved in cell wall biosynthesis